MAQVHEVRRRVPFAPSAVFDVVADVRAYPHFLKWVKAMSVREDAVKDGRGHLVARAVIGYKFVRETFTTRVTLDKPNLAIDVAFVDGPFNTLENRWRFHPAPDGATEVDFWIRYQFRNPILQALIEANLGRAASVLMGAFEARAAAVCQPVGALTPPAASPVV